MVKKMRYRITTDGRGKISSGEKSEKGLPRALDYFDVKDFPELVQMYGDKPTSLMVLPPTDRIEDFFETAFQSWGAGPKGPVKKRTCDGEVCLHRINETINGIDFAAGEESECLCEKLAEDSKDRCRFDCYFKVFIGNPKTGNIENSSCYLFTTHSQNSADAIFSDLDKVKSLNMGVIRFIPFILSVKMCSGKTDAAHKFPIWSLQVMGMLADIRKRAGGLIGFDAPKQIEGATDSVKPEYSPIPNFPKSAEILHDFILAVNHQEGKHARAWLKAEQEKLGLEAIPTFTAIPEVDVRKMYEANRGRIEDFLKNSNTLGL